MLPQRLDTTLAFKAISLSAALTGTEKCVAAAILDSFNRRTGQCDPSFDRIAHLTGKSRRTVIRAVQRLERMRFLLKVRHGGHFHRNSYQPNWVHFRGLESHWVARRATRHWTPNSAPSDVPKPCHLAGGQTVTQTPLINNSQETCHELIVVDQSSTIAKVTKGNSRQEESTVARAISSRPNLSSSGPVLKGSAFAQESAAERRWNSALMKRFIGTPGLFALAIDALDRELQEKATAAEMRQRGSGLTFIIEALFKRGIML